MLYKLSLSIIYDDILSSCNYFRTEAGRAVYDRVGQVDRQHYGRHCPSHLHVWRHG